nr:ribonuclease H-like domain-containing protein [Tanacetum cinerariifolium]
MNQFCEIKGIKKEFSNARTPQKNRVAKRKHRTLIEAARTMLADSLLPIPFWAEAVNTACYVQNRVLVTKPHNKTPYELLIGKTHIISFMRPFGCPVTILNTLDHLGKFDGKADEEFLVRSDPEWLFDIDSLTNSMNYQPVSVGNRTNGIAGLKIHSDARQEGKAKVPDQEYILLPVLNTSLDVPSRNEEVVSSPKDDAGKKSTVEPTCVEGGKINDLGYGTFQGTFQRTYGKWNFSTPITVNAVGSSFSYPATLDDFSKMPNLEDTKIFDDAYDDRDEDAEADYDNLETMEPKNVTQALDDESWVEAMQEELL